MAFDTVTSTYSPRQIHPQRSPGKQVRLPVKLVASTVYPAGSVLGEVTATPGTFGLTITITNMALTSNVVTATTKGNHGLSVGNTVAVTAVTTTTANGTGLTVLSVPTAKTFTYAKTASDVVSAADTGKVVRNAGTDIPKAILSIALVTDANGVIYQGDTADGIDGTENAASPYFTGEFRTDELANFDAVVLAAMTGAKLLAGTTSAGLVKIA